MTAATEQSKSERELIDQFADSMAGLVKAFPPAHRAAAQKALVEVNGMLIALRRRIERLEAREYAGVWNSSAEYEKGTFVTSGGSLWCAKIKTKGVKPGDNACWQLAVKRGVNGKDLRA